MVLAGTPLNFTGSALLLGGLQVILVLTILTGVQGPDNDTSGADIFMNIAFIAAMVGFMLKILGVGVDPSLRANSPVLLKTSQPVIQGLGIILCGIYMKSIGNKSFQLAFLALAALSMITGEIIHRVRFYKNNKSIGL